MEEQKPMKKIEKEKTLEYFSATACRHCPHIACCKAEPAFVIPEEIEEIEGVTQMTPEEFAVKKEMNGKTFYLLKHKEDGSCIFLDANERCSIYDHRPTDCRLFPLDIAKSDGKFIWITYGNQICQQKSLTKIFYSKLAEIAEEKLLPRIYRYLEEYTAGTHSVGFYKDGLWTKLKELKPSRMRRHW